MSELVKFLENLYIKAKSNNFEWKSIYPNNMLQNGVVGIYTDMFFEKDNKYTYLKYSIEYCSRCDKDGMSHPEEGIRYFVLHELRMRDLDEKFEIPEPAREFRWDDRDSHRVNDYGRFRYVFDDVETAKCVVANEVLMILYPYTYLLNEEEGKEWNDFLDKFQETP